jgi:glycosyltransferase involved in cell wall biosynthesis
VPPPIERPAADGLAVAVPAARGGEPVFGVYDPHASADVLSFISHALKLTGRPRAVAMQIALRDAPPSPPAAAVSFVPAQGVDGFVAGIDMLAVPAYDDSVAAALMAALRAGKPVIVPDRGGAAELIEYGRHGFMFAAGSPYHFANALNVLSQSWRDRPVLLAEGGPAIARTHPAAVAHAFAAVYERLLATRGNDRSATPRYVNG